jgi:hypothetical protein
MKFEFTDKTTYLAWRLQWKISYMALSAEIRDRKRRRKEFITQYRWETTPQGPVRKLISREPNPLPFEPMLGLRAQAAFQMELLTEAKALSWSMKQTNAKLASQAA